MYNTPAVRPFYENFCFMLVVETEHLWSTLPNSDDYIRANLLFVITAVQVYIEVTASRTI